MKVVSTEALTKLIQLIKSSFISVDDTEQTSEIETETPTEITLATVATSGDYDDLTNKPTVYHPDLLSFQWSDHLLNNVSWLRADTFSWQDGTVYAAAYEHLTDDITGITPTTETVGSNTITVYVATDGHKIVLEDQAQTVQDIYNETGVAWYFILDTTNQRFKLPRTKFGLTGLRDSVGNYVTESLPNITGELNYACLDRVAALGAFSKNSKDSGHGYRGGEYTDTGVDFDASRSSSTYQNNAPVQQRATQMYLYFYVGDYTQSALEQTAGLNSELFNGKMDRDMSNMNASQTAKETIVGWGMPDYDSGVSISTPSQNNPYIASYACLISFSAVSYNGNNYVYINGNALPLQGSSANTTIPWTIYLDTGDSIYCDAGTQNPWIVFPLKGVQNA